MRDHTKLRAFELADSIAVEIYRLTAAFPKDELFGLTSQMRRAAVSVVSNIVEGCAYDSQAEYRHFLEIAFGSLKELHYQYGLALWLSYVKGADLDEKMTETEKVLGALIRSMHSK